MILSLERDFESITKNYHTINIHVGGYLVQNSLFLRTQTHTHAQTEVIALWTSKVAGNKVNRCY